MLPLELRKRVIVCLDVDCFEVQLWLKHLYGQYLDRDIPIVVVNPDNVVLSFNYSARAPKYRIRKGMDKSLLCKMELQHPELTVLCTGFRNGRCDTFTPCQESDIFMSAVMRAVMKHKGVLVERASRDEVFLYITAALQDSWDWNMCASNDQLLSGKKIYPSCKEHDGRPKMILYSDATRTGEDICNRMVGVEDPSEEDLIIQGGIFSQILIEEIFKETGYYCSAGIGPNKLIAKVASEFNKPAGVAMMTSSGFIKQTSSLSFKKIPGLKRNSGDRMRQFYEEKMGRPLEFVSQIKDLSREQLCEFYRHKGEKVASGKAETLHASVRGIDCDLVKNKRYDNCMGFSYTFRGTHKAKEWDVEDVANDMVERMNYLKKHQRRLPEYLLLRIGYATKDGPGDITKLLDDEQKFNPRDLMDFINDARIENDIDLEYVKVFQFRAMNCSHF